MTLTAVEGSPVNATWSDVLRANVACSGADPKLVWETAITETGGVTVGPDSSGEYSSTCPNPSHNGGSGDHKASLRWRQALDGQVFYHCHAQCDAEDIVTSLGLTFTQLRWPRTDYVYRSELRELLAVHVKSPMPGGKKRYWWQHEENGELVSGRGTSWEDVLWCLPDLQQTAERARHANIPIHLWLTEGEKDSLFTAYALDAGWVPEGEEHWCHLVTTSPDGASTWRRELTAQTLNLGPTQVTILADSDEAGVRHGTAITEALLDSAPTLSVNTVSWAGHPENIKDAANAVERFGAGWYREASSAGEADPYLWCTADSGWLFEADAVDINGQPSGRKTLHRMVSPGTRAMRPEAIAKWPVRVVAATVDAEGRPVGWEVDLGPGGVHPIESGDLVGSSIEAWNAKIGLFIVPTRSLGPAFRAYLGAHSQNSPQMAVWDHEGWVDNETFVTGNGVLVGKPALIGRAQAGATEWNYGEADPEEAARLLAEILTFRPLKESAPVVAWLAAVAIRPHALEASGSSFVPMLQVPGDSGTGKTSFLRLATRVFGLAANPVSNVTTAGLVRLLALTTQHVWIDDFANYDDAIRDIIRGGLTGAGRTRGTTASERGIVRDEARAALINSGETAMGLEERAMRQRSVVVSFTERAQGRTSRRPGKEERGQYADMVEMGVDREDGGAGLSRWAGSVVRGLYTTSVRLRSESLEQRGASSRISLVGAEDGVREAAAWRFVEYGGLVAAEWLRSSGVDATRVAKFESVVGICVREAVAAAEQRERTGSDVHLVTTLVPAYLRARRMTSDVGVVASLRTDEELNGLTIVRAIRDAWKSAGPVLEGTDGLPARGAVLVTNPKIDGGDNVVALALCASALAEWAMSDDGRRAGIGGDRRFVTREGVGMQVAAISNKSPEFSAGGGSNGKVRVKLSAGQSPQYSIVTDPDVVRAVLGS